jgi:hypothetical protein
MKIGPPSEGYATGCLVSSRKDIQRNADNYMTSSFFPRRLGGGGGGSRKLMNDDDSATRANSILKQNFPLSVGRIASKFVLKQEASNGKWSHSSIRTNMNPAMNPHRTYRPPSDMIVASSWSSISQSVSSALYSSDDIAMVLSNQLDACKKSRKMIAFDEERNTVIEPDPNFVIDDFRNVLWWNTKDRMLSIEKRNREVQQLLRQYNRPYCQAIRTVYTYCQNNGESEVSRESVNDSDEEVRNAIQILVKSQFRGLERIICKSWQMQLLNASVEPHPTTLAKKTEVCVVGVADDAILGQEAKQTANKTMNEMSFVVSPSARMRKRIVAYYQEHVHASSLSMDGYLNDFVAPDDRAAKEWDVSIFLDPNPSQYLFASYCQSFEERSKSMLWARLMAMGDAVVDHSVSVSTESTHHGLLLDI